MSRARLRLSGGEVRAAVVGGKTTDAEIIQKLLHVLGLSFGPVEIGSVEFDDLVAHLCHGAHGAGGIVF